MMMERFSFYSRPYAFGGLFAGAVLSALLMQPLRLLPGGRAASLCALLLYGLLMGTGWPGRCARW